MPKWVDVFKSGVLEKHGPNHHTVTGLAAAISEELGEIISANRLDAAFRRHRAVLKLEDKLSNYIAVPVPVAPEEPGDAQKAKKLLKPEDISFSLSREYRREIKKAKRFIITSAMNNSKLDANVWNSIQNWADANEAAIIVIPVRYRNPTTPDECSKQDEEAWWPPEILDYMTDNLLKVHEKLWIMAHVRVNATAVTPLSGLTALSNGASAIFGHAQLAMEMVATPQQKLPKLMYTTQSISVPNYSDTKAGIKGEFHHGLGAVVVELDKSRFYVRSVTADATGGFYDLDRYYGPEGVMKSPQVSAIVTGDEHVQFNDSKCRAATYLNKDSIVKTLKPQVIVRHDVLDGYSISHHNRYDPVIQLSKYREGHNSLEKELTDVVKFIDETTPKGVENLIVSSNHHDHVLQWIKKVDAFFEEPWNAEIQNELRRLLINTMEYKERGVTHGDPFALWCEPRIKSDVKFLGPDSSESIEGVAIGMHGHNGINGSRGSRNQFAKIGVETIVGHSHTPGIKHKCFQVGTSSTLRMDYTKGPSSWAHAHCIIYPNGKRQLIFVIDGHWRVQ